MPNLIQIRRSESTAAPSSLANGELAFSSASNVLFIGMKNEVYPIGGARSPGSLVANQAIVVNSSSLIDTIRVGNTTTNVVSNTSGIFLANAASNTRLTIPTAAQYTGGDYWLNANGSWLQIPVAVTTLDGLSDVTITSVGNNHLLVYNQATSQWINKAAGDGIKFVSQSLTIDANNGIVANSTGVHVLVGNNQLIANATGLWVDQSKLNHDALLNYDANKHVDHTAVSITAGAGLTGGGTIAASRTIAVFANSGLVANSTGAHVLVGNNQLIANATGLWVDQSKIDHNALINYAAARHIDHTAVSITAGAGLTGGGNIDASRTIDVGAGNGIAVATDSISVVAGTGVTVNATGVHIGQAVGTTSAVTFQDLTVNGNTVLGDAIGDRITINGYVNTAIIPEANNTRDLGSTGLRWNNIFGKDITANTLSIAADATISGNLVVVGDLVTLNVSTLTVEDPLIELARLNPADTIDIGFYGLYVESTTNKYTGLFRDASDSDKFKLFNGLTAAPTTTVDTGGTGYTQGTLVSHIETGALITNATHVAITANSTVNVAITANNLTLSSPLVGTSGGTGLSSYNAEDILVANSSNGFRKLAKGTDGFVLQISSGVVAYGSLDGGTF